MEPALDQTYALVKEVSMEQIARKVYGWNIKQIECYDACFLSK